MKMCVVGLGSFGCLPSSLQDNSDILFSTFSTFSQALVVTGSDATYSVIENHL